MSAYTKKNYKNVRNMKEKKRLCEPPGGNAYYNYIEDFIFCIKNLKENPKKNSYRPYPVAVFFTYHYNIRKLSIIFPNCIIL